jgi:cytochrome b involved in lipid metabolism
MERKDSMFKDEHTPLDDHSIDHDGGDLNFRTNPVVATTEVVKTTRARRWWIALTWLFTWWIPSFLLIHLGKMKRADMRQAWREKVAIFLMIFSLCGIVIFYIIIFGRLLCPNSAKAWNMSELATHQGEDDYYAAIRGKVYDVSPLDPILHLNVDDSLRHSTKDNIRTYKHTQLHPV